MRNLVTGNYNNKTAIRSGYTKKTKDYKEGEIWEEKGKMWTIKRGIKRTVNKLNSIRKLISTPLVCPKCEGNMNHPAHKQMYRLWKMCTTCVMSWEQDMKIQGTYDDFMKHFDKSNFDATIKDITSEYNNWLEERNSQSFVTEAGDIEEWSGGETNEKLEVEFQQKIKRAQERQDEIKSVKTDN